MRIVLDGSALSRSEAFAAISAVASECAGLPTWRGRVTSKLLVPCVSEPWYCCAEPMEML
jgi:hypothetical protein